MSCFDPRKALAPRITRNRIAHEPSGQASGVSRYLGKSRKPIGLKTCPRGEVGFGLRGEFRNSLRFRALGPTGVDLIPTALRVFRIDPDMDCFTAKAETPADLDEGKPLAVEALCLIDLLWRHVGGVDGAHFGASGWVAVAAREDIATARLQGSAVWELFLTGRPFPARARWGCEAPSRDRKGRTEMAEKRFLELVSFTAGSSAEHLSSRKWSAKFRGGIEGFTSTVIEIPVAAGCRSDDGEYVEITPAQALETSQRLAAEFFLAVAFAKRDWMADGLREKLTKTFPPKEPLSGDDDPSEPVPRGAE